MIHDLSDTAVIWCWQLPVAAPIGVVRLVCARNAFSTVATESKHPDVRASLMRTLGAFTAATAEGGERVVVPRDRVAMQSMLELAATHPERSVMTAVDDLWWCVLQHHRADWQEETRRLIGEWDAPPKEAPKLRSRRRGGLTNAA